MSVQVKVATPELPSGAIIIQGTKRSPHIALWFRDQDDVGRCLSMSLGGLLCEDDFIAPAKFVVPASSAQELADLCDLAERFWHKNLRASVPFGFDLRGVRVSANGALTLMSEGQLTCASLIVLLFEAIGAPLLLREQWSRQDERRQREDDAARRSLSAQLRPARNLQAPPSGARFRPEEVAAASGLSDRPVGFEVATKAGQDVLNHLPS